MNRTEHLLVCLMEECSEVQKAAAKALRFGVDDGAPSGSTTNAQDIIYELRDLVAVVHMLDKDGDINLHDPGVPEFIQFNIEQLQPKIDKVERFMEYASGRGRLHDV